MSAITSDAYELLTASAGVVVRERGIIELGGTEAAEFLQGQVTNDVEALEAGSGCYAALLTHKGRIRTDMRVLRVEDGFVIDTEPVGHPILAKMIATYSLGREVKMADLTEMRTVASIIGPDSHTSLDIEPGPAEHDSVAGHHGLYVTTDVGVDVIGEVTAEALASALGLEVVPEDVAECVRIERGRPRLGIELGGETIPQEADLNARAVSFTKGCYVGQETVARLHYKGRPNRHLRGLRLSRPATTGEPVVLGDRDVGVVASTCVSPRHGPIALSIVRREAVPGDEVGVGSDRAPAEITDLPFA